ncbi:hypothetical protein ACQR2B_06735 [Bradyrhizobium oligotrophicum]|uniref:hypothetical protein n=1 Tax=Bradyrhizobium TaxID=374 RepID=UPI003EB9439F
MPNQRYDVLAIALLMFTVVFAVWLGLLGPIDVSKLKEWQTVMAAIIAPTLALVPATIAYKGAMAKVDHDREEAERRRRNEQLGLFLRLRAAVKQTLSDANKAAYLIDERLPTDFRLQTSIRVIPDQIAIAYPPEIKEAWANLHLMPSTAVVPLETLKRIIPIIEGALSRCANDSWTINFPGALIGSTYNRVADDFLRLHSARCRPVQAACKFILDALEDEIPRLQNRFQDAR